MEVGFRIANQGTPLGWQAKPVAQLPNGLWIGFVRMVISTPDAGNAYAELMVSQELFNAGIWSADDHPCKPDPQAVLELCNRLGLPPQRCALVGDAETDLQMAPEAGIGGVIGFTGGWKSAPKLPSAQHLLHSWDHLSVSTNS